MHRTACAEERRVAVINGDPVLVDAISHALSPWGLRVFLVTVSDVASTDMPRAASQARDIAYKAPAEALVWITTVAGGSASDSLWIYDAATQAIVVRPLGASPPIDTAAAASIALSVKTLLRSTTVAPIREQTAPPPRPPELPASPAPAPDAAPRSSAPPARVVQRLRLEAAVGARVLAGAARVEPRPSLALSYWPAFLSGRFGLALGAALGPGVSVDENAFTGTYTDTALTAALRFRIPVSAFELELAGGSSAHFTRIDGNFGAANAHTGASRMNPAVDASATFLFRASARVDVGIVAGGSYFLKYQSYFAASQPVFALSPFEPSTALRLAVTLN